MLAIRAVLRAFRATDSPVLDKQIKIMPLEVRYKLASIRHFGKIKLQIESLVGTPVVKMHVGIFADNHGRREIFDIRSRAYAKIKLEDGQTLPYERFQRWLCTDDALSGFSREVYGRLQN